MREDCSLSVAVHECLLAAECLDAEIRREAFNIKAAGKNVAILLRSGATYHVFAYTI